MPSLKRFDGELTIDHRAGAGLPEHVAVQAGFDPRLVRAGALFETATITCNHCKVAVVKNPYRIRERAYCRKCDHYICDSCSAEAASADYVHQTFDSKADAARESALRGESTVPALTTKIIVP